MDRDRYQQIRDVFHDVARQPLGERDATLDERCCDDTELRDAVVALLVDLELDEDEPTRANRAMTSGLRDRAAHAVLTALDDTPEQLGPYRLLHRIGEGGMGVVYEAEQDEPRRRVAVKIVRPGVSGDDALRRFRDEAAILARLAHPGIAQVLQAGTEATNGDRRAWMAMELVRGLPVDEHVRRHAPDTTTRLRLLVAIADAVAHAHRHGVVHRDLKPANILVVDGDDDAVCVKVLDFGIARLTDADIHATRHTHGGQLVGTLAAMSPEQVRGDDDAIDTSTDTWALGVIAYEVLAGRPPIDLSGVGFGEAARRILELDPTPLGQLEPALRGDVEAVVAKALEKDPARRYNGAAAWGDDLRRVLAHEPVTARRLTTLYQLSKLARRHRALVAGVVLAVVGLGAGLVAALHQASVADEARLVAVREAKLAESVTTFMIDSFEQADPRRTGGRDVSMRDALDVARARLASGAFESTDLRSATLSSFARTYDAIGAIEESEQLAREAVRAAGDDGDTRRRALDVLASTLMTAQRWAEAATVWREALDVGDDVELHARRASPWELERLLVLAECVAQGENVDEALAITAIVAAEVTRRADRVSDELDSVAIELAASRSAIHRIAGNWAEAVSHGEYVLAKRVARGDDRLTLSGSRSDLAQALARNGDNVRAREVMVESIADLTSVLGDGHPSFALRTSSLGMIHEALGDWSAALEAHHRALDVLRARLGDEHAALTTPLSNVGIAYTNSGDPATGVEYTQAAVDLSRAAGSALARATVLHNHADVLAELGRVDEAAAALGESLQLLVGQVGDDHPHVITTLNSMAALLNDAGHSRDALPLARRVVAWRAENLGPDHPDTAQAINNLGWTLHLVGEREEAIEHLTEALARDRRLLGDDHHATAQTWLNLGLALAGAGQVAEALTVFNDAYASWAAAWGVDHPESRSLLARIDDYRANVAAVGETP